MLEVSKQAPLSRSKGSYTINWSNYMWLTRKWLWIVQKEISDCWRTISFAGGMVGIRSGAVSKGRSSEPGPQSVVFRGGPATVIPLEITVTTAVLICAITAVVVEVAYFVRGNTPGRVQNNNREKIQWIEPQNNLMSSWLIIKESIQKWRLNFKFSSLIFPKLHQLGSSEAHEVLVVTERGYETGLHRNVVDSDVSSEADSPSTNKHEPSCVLFVDDGWSFLPRVTLVTLLSDYRRVTCRQAGVLFL